MILLNSILITQKMEKFPVILMRQNVSYVSKVPNILKCVNFEKKKYPLTFRLQLNVSRGYSGRTRTEIKSRLITIQPVLPRLLGLSGRFFIT
jgi:hypothetical protein